MQRSKRKRHENPSTVADEDGHLWALNRKARRWFNKRGLKDFAVKGIQLFVVGKDSHGDKIYAFPDGMKMQRFIPRYVPSVRKRNKYTFGLAKTSTA